MVERFRIAAYTRISVDLELDRDNTSIENQKAIIEEYCRLHFPTSPVDTSRIATNRATPSSNAPITCVCAKSSCSTNTIYLSSRI